MACYNKIFYNVCALYGCYMDDDPIYDILDCIYEDVKALNYIAIEFLDEEVKDIILKKLKNEKEKTIRFLEHYSKFILALKHKHESDTGHIYEKMTRADIENATKYIKYIYDLVIAMIESSKKNKGKHVFH